MTEDNEPEEQGLSRRTIALGLGALAAGAGIGGYFMLSPDNGDGEAQADPTLEELLEEGPLPDIPAGSADAPVTIIEYSSMTCPHCANFHKTVLPELKEKYVETGKARYIVREFPLNNLAVAASMLTRCVDKEKYHPFLEALYVKQDVWAFGEGDPVPRLFNMAKQVGFSKESFDKCLSDQSLVDKLVASRKRGNEKFGVRSTPTFFVNGKLVRGASTLKDIEDAMAPHLKG